MEQRWVQFWKLGVRKSAIGALTFTPLVAAFLVLLDVPRYENWAMFWSRCLQSLVYAYAIWFCLTVVTWLAWGFVTWMNTPKCYGFTRRMWFHLLYSLLGVLLGLVLAYDLDFRFFGQAKPPFMDYYRDFMLGVLISLVIIFVVGYLERKKQAAQLARANAEAKYGALKAQMHPHFLFNSLDSLLALIESQSDKAESMTQKLSDLYREILASSERETDSLAQELAIVESYLEIESVRFGERLAYKFEVDLEAARTIEIPSLIVQTLVENAIKHGIAPAMNGGSIVVSAAIDHRSALISVINTGMMLSEAIKPGGGLSITKERLDLRWGASHQFALERSPEGSTIARFRVPRAEGRLS